jgi:hypothetical protein
MAAMFAIADDPSLGVAETLDASMACLSDGLQL